MNARGQLDGWISIAPGVEVNAKGLSELPVGALTVLADSIEVKGVDTSDPYEGDWFSVAVNDLQLDVNIRNHGGGWKADFYHDGVTAITPFVTIPLITAGEVGGCDVLSGEFLS